MNTERSSNVQSTHDVGSVFDTSAVNLREPRTQEAMSLDGYDTQGGRSVDPVVLQPNLGATGAADTVTSGNVGHEAWERDRLTGMTEQELQAKLQESYHRLASDRISGDKNALPGRGFEVGKGRQ